MYYMKLWTCSVALGALVLACAAPTSRALAQQEPAKSNPNQPRTVRLTVYPAAPPAIAMKHRLMPRYLDLVPGNAAVQYLKALPEGGDATIKKHAERMEELLEQKREDFEVDEARKILQDFGSVFEFLKLASVRDECQWDLPIREQDVYSILLPELQSMRQFGRSLALRARVQIAEGELEQAIESLRLGYVAARHTANGSTLVNALVGVAIARMMNERLLELMQHPQAPNLYWSIAALPDPFIDVRRAMDLESDGVYLMFPQLKDVATAKLTDQQWNVRLAEFAAKLESLGPTDVPEGNWQGWKNSLARSLGVAAIVTLNHSRAKADLVSYGWPNEQVEKMATAQVILLHIGQTYEIMRDDLFKWFHIPYWQAETGTDVAEDSLSKMRGREILPLASLLLPALSAARLAVTRLDREIAAMQTVEALRFYAAKNDGKLPARLEDITDIPVPIDPITGRLFDYKLQGRSITLDGKAPAGQAPEHAGLRLIVTMADAKVATLPHARSSAQRRPDDSQIRWWMVKTQGLFSDIAKDLGHLVTTNPILEFGANGRKQQSIRNLMHIGLALANYNDVYKHYPPSASVDKNAKPLLSWRVHVLPFLDQTELYRQFKLDEPWDSEHNKKLIEKMPSVYRVPILPPLPKYTTTYLVPVGKETAFHDDKGTTIKQITDGLSHTVLLVEADADQAIVWTKPGDWQFDPAQPTRGLGQLRGNRFLVGFGDSSVSERSPAQEKDRMGAIFTRAGGEKLSR
jgi:hypothetical protein